MNMKIDLSRWRLLIVALFPLGIGLCLVCALAFGPDPPGAKLREHRLPGLTIYQRSSPTHALVVTSVESGSPAEAARITVGDEILAINGRPVSSLRDIDAYRATPPNNSLAVRLRHNETGMETELILGNGHHRGT